MESYEQKHKEALGWMKSLYGGLHGKTKEEAEKYFTELKESEDEKVKRIIHSISNKISFHLHNIFTEEEFQCFDAWSNAWLKKQNKHQQLYIRFGNIPSNEKSKIYRGEEEFGYENGVSVYPAFEDVNGNIVLGLSLPITKTTLYTQQHLIEYDDRLCYLVKGDYVGKGTDGEPLIKNVRIIKEIKPYRMKQDKENNIYIINNTPNCSISVYNEELKESEDERIRKWLICGMNALKEQKNETFATIPIDDVIAWLEKQSEQNYKIIKGKNYFCIKTHNYAGVGWIKGTKYYASDNYTLVNQGCEYYCPEYSKDEHNNLFEEVKYDGCVENNMSVNKVEPIQQENFAPNTEPNLANSAKTCKNDTLLDLLNKMPSYITVDGIFYHFILRKTALACTAYYAGEEEGSGKVIFAMTSFSPIDLLTAMLEKLKKEGLLE